METSLNINTILAHPDFIYNPVPKAKMDTGKFCNAKCHFCYYLSEVNNKKSQITLKKFDEELLKLKDAGITNVELSGGEPTIHKHFLPMIKRISQSGMTPSIVTNGTLGRTPSGIAKLRKAILAGLNEVLISIHGFEEDHDKVVLGVDNSTVMWDSIIKLIRVCFEYQGKVKIRINVTIDNALRFRKMFEFLLSMVRSDVTVNLLPLNYWDDANNQKINPENIQAIYQAMNDFTSECIDFVNKHRKVSYRRLGLSKRETSIGLKDAIQTLHNKLNIRYPQMCLLSPISILFAKGHYHHLIDHQDWNKVMYPDDYTYPDTSYNIGNQDNQANQAIEVNVARRDRIDSHIKDIKFLGCNKCPLRLICDGQKKEEFKYLNEPLQINSEFKELTRTLPLQDELASSNNNIPDKLINPVLRYLNNKTIKQ